MDLPERPSDSAPPSTVEELQQAYRSLRMLLNGVLVILLILTGSFALYLLREVSFLRGQMREYSQFVANYDRNSKPVMQDFLNKLQAFAKANPDFAAILAKYYNPTNAPTASTNTLSGQQGASPVRMPPALPPR